MKKTLQVYFSNRVELLYERLKKELFAVNTNPFARRMIIVPSPAMKSWLMHRMANDPALAIAAGIEIAYLDQTIQWLVNYIPEHSSRPQLSILETALAIEQEIRSTLINPTPLWQPVAHYLKSSSKGLLTRKGERRLTTLSGKLAKLFSQYGKYGGRMVAEWDLLKEKGWQQELWQKLFSNLWSYPSLELSRLIHDVPLKTSRADLQVHLFSLSYLPQLQHQFLTHISTEVAVSYYILSPCQVFWSDLRSDRERAALQKVWKLKKASEQQQTSLDEYLRDCNPLLANFGRLGREMAQQIEESSALTTEAYLLSERVQQHTSYQEQFTDDLLFEQSAQEELSLLEALQSDMTLLRNPDQTEKIEISHLDDSVQIHVASSKMREVQILYHSLLRLIAKHNSETSPLTPSDIVVMTPDINGYAPYIKAVFDSPESLLSAQILDLALPSQNRTIQGFFHLLTLPSSRWDVSSLLQLFNHPAFQERHKLNLEEIRTIQEWIKATDVRWGIDADHRNELLIRDHCQRGMVEETYIGTWSYALDQLVASLAVSKMADVQLQNVETSQSLLLGKWIFIIRSLQKDLKCLQDGTCMTLGEWSQYLRCLFESYFSTDETRDETLNSFFQFLDSFRQAEEKLGSGSFPFTTIYHHLTEACERPSESYRERNLNSVRFCAMLPMRAIPAKVVAMIGMDEEAYPRKDQPFSLDLLQKHPNADYCPSQIDYDRFLFLESILSARRYLVISYQGYSASDGKEKQPSLLVTELLSYLDRAYYMEDGKPSQYCVKHHPFHSFDYRYFTQEASFPNYSPSDYKNATAYYQIEKQPNQSFISSFKEDTLNQSPTEESIIRISIKDLVAMARDPVKAYFNKTLGIYLENSEKRQAKNEEDFQLSQLKNYLLKKDSLKKPIEQLLNNANLTGQLPIGPFKQITIEKFQTEIDEVKKFLTELKITPDHIVDVQLSEDCEQLEMNDSIWKLPPLRIPLKGKMIHITGTLSDITSQGMATQRKNSRIDITKIWPEFLIYTSIVKLHALPLEPQILFGGQRVIKKSFHSDPMHPLENYIDYYLKALDTVSPLIPDWIPDLLNKDPAVFEETMRSSISNDGFRFPNEYLQWALHENALPDSQCLIDDWRPCAQQLFAELYSQWYPTKEKSRN